MTEVVDDKAILIKKIKLEEKHDIIHYTMEHRRFRFLSGNRDIDDNHTKVLLNEIKKTKFVVPICVTEDLDVIDGQHRLRVCTILQIPVPFYVVPHKTEAQKKALIGTLNSNMKNWSNMDFLNNYDAQGNKNYQLFKEVLLQNDVPLSTLAAIIIGGSATFGGDVNRIFKNGELIFTGFYGSHLEQQLRDIKEIQEMTDEWKSFSKSSRFIKALYTMMSHPLYRQTRMLKELDVDITFLKRKELWSDYLDLLTLIYNRTARGRDHLKFSEKNKNEGIK